MNPPAPASALHRVRMIALALLGALAMLVATAGQGVAAGPSTGWVRLAHFSPDTPEVDVYLTSFAAPDAPRVIPAVGYGALSEYQQLPTGRYSVGMRLAGAKASSPVVITTDVTVKGGRAYTVAGVGRNADLALSVIPDDLSAPKAGQARLRVIQASSRAPVVSLNDSAGGVLADGARFATTSPYVDLPAGPRTLELTAADARIAETTLRAAAGGVYSLVVLDEGDGVAMLVRNDSSSARKAPKGGVATGLGGLESGVVPATPAGAESGLPAGPVALAAVLALAAVALVRPARAALRA